jgi:hypothetical protein
LPVARPGPGRGRTFMTRLGFKPLIPESERPFISARNVSCNRINLLPALWLSLQSISYTLFSEKCNLFSRCNVKTAKCVHCCVAHTIDSQRHVFVVYSALLLCVYKWQNTKCIRVDHTNRSHISGCLIIRSIKFQYPCNCL